MAIIAFSKDPAQTWCKAGWAFRQVIDDVLAQYPNDPAMNAELEEAKAAKGLSLFLMDSELAARVSAAIRHAATRILAGEIRSGIHDQDYGDPMTVMQYHDSLRELLDIIPGVASRP